MMEEFEVVVDKKYMFEYWENFKKVAFLPQNRTAKTLMQKTQIDNAPVEKPGYIWNVFAGDPDGRDKACSFGEIGGWKGKNLNLKGFLYQDFDAREKNDHFSFEILHTSALCSIEILMEEIEMVAAQMQRFDYRAKSKEIALFFGNFESSTNRECSIETLVGGIIPVDSENNELYSRKNKTFLQFINILAVGIMIERWKVLVSQPNQP